MRPVPGWAPVWCRRELGAEPVESVFAVEAMAAVVAVRLDDGRVVVLKARPATEAVRASRCVAVQRAVAEQGFPCARPITGISRIDGLAVHAEEWRPGGEMMRDAGVDAARLSAELLAELMTLLERIPYEVPLPTPEWVRWDHDGPGLFPPNPRHDPLEAVRALPDVILDTARRAHDRLRRAALPSVLGHADWEAQNLRWRDGVAHAVHDWDSLAWLPEPAIVGAASGAFASTEIPTLAPVASSDAFLDAYAEARGRPFAENELEVAWAASLWPALHNARGEVLYAQPPVALRPLEEQADERLRRAGA